MKKILVIGNSYASDATRYLYGIARAAGKDVKIVNLYIGGCSLYRHYRNMLSEEKAYHYIIDGIETGIYVSLKEALLSDEWNYVVMQQCSPKSGDPQSYFPYITEISEYVKKLSPEAKQYIHMTWSFDEGHKRFTLTSFNGREDMIPAVKSAYNLAAEKIDCNGIIPSMDAMCKLYDVIGAKTYRDGFHCSYGITRYMLGCVWFMVFFGIDVDNNTFRDFDEPVSEDEVELAKRIARETVTENGYKIK